MKPIFYVLVLLCVFTVNVSAQTVPMRVVQTSDNKLYVILSEGRAWQIVPVSNISDDDIAEWSMQGQLDGIVPADLVDSPTELLLVQSSDGTLHLTRLGDVWTLVPAPILDDQLASMHVANTILNTVPSLQARRSTP